MNIVLFSVHDNFFFSVNDERAKHITRVLGKKMGDSFEAGIEGGKSGQARITCIDNEGLHFTFEAQGDGKPLYPVEMIIGFVRPIQLKRLFRDMAGLGVRRIHLVGTELGEKSYMDSKIVERGAAHAALKDGTVQAKSTHVPELIVYTSVRECLATLTNGGENPFLRVCLDNIKPKCSLFEYFLNAQTSSVGAKLPPVYAAIGSERGWTNTERAFFIESAFTLCSMGSRVLRTETAATTALSLILQAMGEL